MKLKKMLKKMDKYGIVMYHHDAPSNIRFTAHDKVFAAMSNISDDDIWDGFLYPNNNYTPTITVYGSFRKVLKKCVKYSISQVDSK